MSFPSADALSDARWHRASITMSTGILQVDSQTIQIPNHTAHASVFSADTGLFLGGVPLWDAQNYARLDSRSNLAGCIRNVQLDGEALNMQDAETTSGVTESCPRATSQVNPCAGNPCGTNGECHDVWDRHICVCDVGYAGNACDDVAPAATFDGSTLLELSFVSNTSSVTNNGFNFDLGFTAGFMFRTRGTAAATLLHVDGVAHPSDSFSIRLLVGGRISISYGDEGVNQVYELIGTVNDGAWHLISVTAPSGNDEGLVCRLDESTQSFDVVSTIATVQVSDGNILLGGLRNAQGEATDTFDGCFRGLQIGRDQVPFDGIHGQIDPVPVGGQVQTGCEGRNVCPADDTNPCDATSTTCVDTWNQFECPCRSGYGPEGICADINDCAPQPCMHQGACTDLVDAFSCNCVDTGYEGDTCSDSVDDCDPQPCQRNGVCTNRHRAFHCDCPVQHAGDTCETDVNECEADPCGSSEFCTQITPECLTAQCQSSWEGFTCTELTVCVEGENFETVSATRTTDRVCSAARECDASQYELVAATTTSDRICAAVSPACAFDAEGLFEQSAPATSSDRICQPCASCPAGEFVSQVCSAFSDTGCTACTTCPASMYAQSSCSTDADTRCAEPTVCAAGSEFMTADFTTTTDRRCAAATVCATDGTRAWRWRLMGTGCAQQFPQAATRSAPRMRCTTNTRRPRTMPIGSARCAHDATGNSTSFSPVPVSPT